MQWKPIIDNKKVEIKYTGDKSLVYASDYKPYVGLYYEAQGRMWTYEKNGTKKSKQLIKKITNKSILNYSKAKGIPSVNVPFPIETISIPTEKDYENGYYERYFAKKVNDKSGLIVEITKAMSNKVRSHPDTVNLYDICEVRWKLVGPRYDTTHDGVSPDYLSSFIKFSGTGQMPNIVYGVHSTNKRTVKKQDKECMRGLVAKIGGDYIKYAKIEKATPFKNPDPTMQNNGNGPQGLFGGQPGWNVGFGVSGGGTGGGTGTGPGGGGGPSTGPVPTPPTGSIPLTDMLLDLNPLYDVYNTSTASAANGERIYKIEDQSVNGWDIIQLDTNDIVMPTFYTGSTSWNGKPYVDFNEEAAPNPNTNEWLQVNGGASAFNVGEATVYLAYETKEGSNSFEGIFVTADTYFLSDGWGLYANRPGPAYTSEKLTGYYDDDFYTEVEGPAFSRYSEKIICFKWSASLAPYLKENGSAWITGSGGTSSPTVYPRDPILGSFWNSYDVNVTLGWNGKIYRLLVYSKFHDDALAQQIMDSLNDDFGGIY